MVIALLCSGIIAGTLAGMAFWIAGYGIAIIALAYWATGSIATIVMIMIKLLLSYSFSCAGGTIKEMEHASRKTNQ